MNRFKITTLITALVFLASGLAYLKVSANEVDNSPSEYDSIYKYNALENKVSFAYSANTAQNLDEITPEKSFEAEDNGKKIEEIIKQQNVSIENLEKALDSVRERGRLEAFLTGNSVGQIRFELVQIKDDAAVLETLALKPENSAYLLQINDQWKLLKLEQKKAEEIIQERTNKFSVFGWLVSII